MAVPLKIFFVSPEISPFAKTGGLADIASALPKEIKNAGHDIRLFMPQYTVVNDRKFVLREVIRLKKLDIPFGDTRIHVNIKSSFLPDTKIQVYFLDYPPYFNREEFYVDPKTNRDYADNAERFALFCRSAIETLKRLHWHPDVIHCNDWQTGFIPVFLKTLYKDDDSFKNTKTLFTIHNLAYQGIFPVSKLKMTGLPDTLFTVGNTLEYYGKVSFLKAGIEYADLINTVSPTYNQEIQNDKELGFGFQDILKRRSKSLYGILNGVDYSEWSPEVDQWIPGKYDSKSLTNKIVDKQQLLGFCNLPYDENVPCIGLISRLVDQKGLDLIVKKFDQIMEPGVQFIILGKGEEKYQEFFTAAAQKYPQQFAAFFRFDNRLAHLIEAGCDMFLMPSKFEPCGLNQLYSLRYGTIPIVRKTGGLADTVVDFSTDEQKGTGFVFEKYDADDFLTTLKLAVHTFGDKKKWKGMIRRGMKQDFSWKASSREYIKLYTKLNKEK